MSRRAGRVGGVRLHAELKLTRDEIKAIDALCASEMRTPGSLVSKIVAEALRRPHPKRWKPTLNAPKGTREICEVQVRMTTEQRQKLVARAHADGRTVANYISALVAGALQVAGEARDKSVVGRD